MQRFCKELADYARVPATIPFLATVTMLSAALGRHLRIQSGPDRYRSGNLYTLLFVSSGVAKSEVFQYVQKPLTDRHRKDREEFFQEISPGIEAKIQQNKLRIDALVGHAKKADGKLDFKDSQELKDY